ncbi:MAG: ABC transporter permease [Clostridium sp.]
MKKFVFKRILQIIPVIFLVSIFAFLIINLAPGDPVNMYIDSSMTEQDIERIRVEMGLEQPIHIRYVKWLKNVSKGDLGYSLINHQPVSTLIKERIPATVGLMGISLLIAIIVSIPLGLIAGFNKNNKIDNIIGFISYIGVSIPSFWFAILLIALFSVILKWLPSNGMRAVGVESTLDLIKHGIMPVIVLSLYNIAIFTRYIRANTISQLAEDYVVTAVAKGLSRASILRRHILKNCLLPIITVVGMNLANLVSGAFITETVFGWPGMGSLGMSGILSRDYPIIMGFTMLSCLLLVIGNMIADTLYGVVDPRIKLGVKS